MIGDWPEPVRQARDLVMQHGWNATAYQIVNPGIDLWFSSGGDAVVGYVKRASIRVVAGAPVSSLERLPAVVEEFETAAADRNEGVCYFGAEGRLEAVARASPQHSTVLLGAQPAWIPATWSQKVEAHSSLRAQLRRAWNKGVAVREWSPREASDSRQLRVVLDHWLRGRGLPPLAFLVEPSTLDRLDDRRIFVASRHAQSAADPEQILAFAVLSPVPSRRGWLVEQFPRVPDAPNGTVEALMHAAGSAVAADGAEYLTMGLAPLAKRRAVPHGDEPRWLKIALDLTNAHTNRFYNFGGLERFKAKFQPDRWEPVYAIQRAESFTPRALYAIAAAFAAGSPVGLVLRAVGKAGMQEIRWLRRAARG